MRAVLAFLSLVSCALAISVTKPNASQGWVLNASNNTVSWTSVSTDRANFTILLVNQNTTPAFQQILVALRDTSGGSTAVSLPNTVTAGSGYRVNLVQDTQNLNSILAQSEDFTIAPASTSSSVLR
ncbi:hypothetical protein K488DRAFT_51560 [Vararia minispora EC-137]|uniref:Uncharacterized protein n=1 Tax=Vararia minispora EC-137 TaxID=1314806 RepID=A0ACB8QK25_9AGAM|nr:hypothetical protein K488DRAFT_51560 [Vararia minispora EC-137]